MTSMSHPHTPHASVNDILCTNFSVRIKSHVLPTENAYKSVPFVVSSSHTHTRVRRDCPRRKWWVDAAVDEADSEVCVGTLVKN
ncbi:hypothetical protein QQF64_013200 [Cirrhinus molitorella]|uniref:Uncharacterized protein n=1 Tax=Cirrhinus molitorella TaxID=172907 RepID=A0ABR3LQF3_9TELE